MISMTIEEMKARKAELGYTNETISQLSGVPLGTVQKIFAGETRSPRYDTVQKLTRLLGGQAHDAEGYEYRPVGAVSEVREPATLFGSDLRSGSLKRRSTQPDSTYMKPPRKTIGIADGKYRMPPDELLFDDEISEMFEDL